ncbi:MAG: Coenzyme F420 hydrogenase/dehydrogenase, beta subunit C-terminal domain [bacterium]|nr:Coenzyme F420 hydrogenase/dehydrogenase, beta subunit C-terminal domain [bacterium]MDA1292349.1 Coenzyme F420 hydrogenase/dehydrogenase, beta subunit C-terminal domain [bacterium]
MKTWTLKQVADHWNNSPDYDAQNAKIDSYFRRFKDSAPLFTIPENAKVLDCDCRTGNGTVFMKKKYPTANFRCVAMAPSFKERAEKNLQAHNLDVEVSVMTQLRQPFDDEHFDTILTYETLEHVPWPTKYIAELSRILKSGGTMVLTTPNVLWEPVHWLSATLHLDHGEGPHRMVPRKEILSALKAAGFTVDTERTFVLIPAGPTWLLSFGYFLEKIFPEWLMRILALRRTFVCTKTNDIWPATHSPEDDVWWHKLKTEVVDTGLETQCGTAVGVSEGTLQYEEQNGVPTVVKMNNTKAVPKASYDACPGRYCNFSDLNEFVFGKQPENMLAGVVEKAYIGHATDESIKKNGASGGVITRTLIHLLETKKITGAVVLRMSKDEPWKAVPFVARTKEEILSSGGSVYSLTPTNTILSELANEEGPLAYVGLPDQVAGIRKLQQLKHPSVANIKYVLGPYTGTQMYFEAIRSFLRSHGVKSETEIADLKYRAGQWPGYLQITLKSGRVLKAEKFYYNYLIPFFITSGSLQLCDFTNELTDISVGDAWSPKYEDLKGGHSVILARTKEAVSLLESMKQAGELSLEEITLTQALDMHGHMIDLKKRGSFIRNSQKPVAPDYGYKPTHIPASRKAVEHVLGTFFWIGRMPLARFVIEHLPLSIVGPCFNILRKTWKNASKPTKRKGLSEMKFTIDSP